MRSLIRSVVQRKDGGLVGRTIKVGPYTGKVEAHLGDGGFATIYRVRDTSSSAVYALKHMRLAGEADARTDCETEVETMKRLRGHPNILTLRAVAYAGPKGAEQEAFLLLDLCRDTLVNYLHERSGQLSNGDVLTIFHSTAKAVAVMHHQSPPLAHRDLKAENILLHSNGTWVLCDFGSASSWAGSYDTTDAVLVAEEHIRKYTTPAYRPPEMFDLYSRVPISTSADLWALGVLLYLLCYGRLPFNGDCKLQVLNGEFSLPPGRPSQFMDLIRGLLTVDPRARTDINEVLQRLERLATSLPEPLAESAAGRTPPAPANRLSSRQPAATSSPATAAPAAGSVSRGSPVEAAAQEATPESPSPLLWPQELTGRLGPRELAALASVEEQHSSSPSHALERAPDTAPRSARGTSAGGGLAAAGVRDVLALQQQLASVSAANAELRATVDAQQATIRRMQAEAQEQAAAIRQLQEDGVSRSPQRGACEGAMPCIVTCEPPTSGTWIASFDSGGAEERACDRLERASPAPPSQPAHFDPFCIAPPGAGPLPKREAAAAVPASGGSGSPMKADGAARHRRTTSEPTLVDSWGREFRL